MRLFADEGQPMAHLLAQISPYTAASPSYIQQLQAAILPTPQTLLDHTQPATSQKLIDPLSARELEVLSRWGGMRSSFRAGGVAGFHIVHQHLSIDIAVSI